MPQLPPAEIKPDLAIVAKVIKIEPAYQSENSANSVIPITFGFLPPFPDAARKYVPRDIRMWLTFMPEWFSKDFRVKSLGEKDFVYRKNVASADPYVGAVQAFLGRDAELNKQFDETGYALPEHTTQSVGDFIHNFLLDNCVGQPVGLILAQQTEGTGFQKVNTEGRPVFNKGGQPVEGTRRLERYEISGRPIKREDMGFFFPTTSSLSFHNNLAAKRVEYDKTWDRAPFVAAYTEDQLT